MKKRFAYHKNKIGEITVWDRQRERSVAGIFKTGKGNYYTYSFPVSGKKPLLLNPLNPAKRKDVAEKKLKAFIQRKYYPKKK